MQVNSNLQNTEMENLVETTTETTVEKVIEPVSITAMRLVKSEDLNHHRTLFAGRSAEWFVEAGFIAVSQLVDPRSAVCLKIHGMQFTKPVNPGQVVSFNAKVAYTGRSSFIVYVAVTIPGTAKVIVDGFISFVHVDDDGKSKPHNIRIQPVTNEDKILFERAKELKR
jgi:acyl-CoA hydrolase